jgi:hypothetical protein
MIQSFVFKESNNFDIPENTLKIAVVTFGGGSGGRLYDSDVASEYVWFDGWNGGISFEIFDPMIVTDKNFVIGAGSFGGQNIAGGYSRFNNTMSRWRHFKSRYYSHREQDPVEYTTNKDDGISAMGMMLKQPDETLSEYLARINSAIETMMPELFASDELKSFYELMNTQLTLRPSGSGSLPIEYDESGNYLPGAAGGGETSVDAGDAAGGVHGAIFLFVETKDV